MKHVTIVLPESFDHFVLCQSDAEITPENLEKMTDQDRKDFVIRGIGDWLTGTGHHPIASEFKKLNVGH